MVKTVSSFTNFNWSAGFTTSTDRFCVNRSVSHKATLFRLYNSFLPSKDLHTLKSTDCQSNNEELLKLALLSSKMAFGLPKLELCSRSRFWFLRRSGQKTELFADGLSTFFEVTVVKCTASIKIHYYISIPQAKKKNRKNNFIVDSFFHENLKNC